MAKNSFQSKENHNDSKTIRKTKKEIKEELSKTPPVLTKLKKLFILNKKDQKKINDNLFKILIDSDLIIQAYDKLQRNKGSHTPGTTNETADGFGECRIKELQDALKKGYQWGNIRRKLIPKPGRKKPRPLGIANFSDRIVQELIRIVLNTIYEPLFQKHELNHGFRPKRSPRTAITKIERELQGMVSAVEGDIEGAYDNVKHKILMKILRQRISDKKFLNLIKNGIKQNIIFKKRKIENIIGVPQGSIVSPMLFNIYMHEFDLIITKEVNSFLNQKNIIEKRIEKRIENPLAKRYNQIRGQREGLQKKIKNLLSNKSELNEYEKEKFHELLNEKRKKKSQILRLESLNRSRKTLFLSYTRYADDWIILTNANERTCQEIKKLAAKLLKEKLRLNLALDKTSITDLEKKPAKFLGFTLRKTPSKITKRIQKEKNTFIRARTTIGLKIGIDHERILNRLRQHQLINNKNKTHHVGIYCSLKPWEIVTKFKQRILGVFNYYYYSLTMKSDLKYYHYIHNYSCLKTLAHRKKISISKIIHEYGRKLKMKYKTYKRDSNGKIVGKDNAVEFPIYQELMKFLGGKVEKKKREEFFNLKNRKNDKMTINEKFLLEPIDFADILKHKEILHEPFTEQDLVINARTGIKIHGYCVICGAEGSPENNYTKSQRKKIKKETSKKEKEKQRNLKKRRARKNKQNLKKRRNMTHKKIPIYLRIRQAHEKQRRLEKKEK
jgi:group II intron reverse transcriptase/maturase